MSRARLRAPPKMGFFCCRSGKWSIPWGRMRRSWECTRRRTSRWSICYSTSVFSCTPRSAGGTAMHTLTNTRPTDRHTYGHTSLRVDDKIYSRSFFFHFSLILKLQEKNWLDSSSFSFMLSLAGVYTVSSYLSIVRGMCVLRAAMCVRMCGLYIVLFESTIIWL